VNALSVLVLLLFFIVLALSLTVWAALAVGTRRRWASGAAVPEAAAAMREAATAQNAPAGSDRTPATPRRTADLPWLKPQPEVDPAPARADRSSAGARRPRVVDTDLQGDGAAVGGREARGAGRARSDQEPVADQEPARATVTPRRVEPNAFDRFLDAERRRE